MKLKPKPKEKVNPRHVLTRYQERMEASITKQGVILFDTDSGCLNINSNYLILPMSVVELVSFELGEYLNAFTQQKMYMRTLMGRLELLVEEARRDYHEASDPIYRRYSNSKMSETAKDRLINSDKEVKEYYEIYQDVKNQLKIVQYSLENIEDAIFMLSREVTRRDTDMNEENRLYNVAKK